ncbi:ribonuclease P/MRP subunit p14 a [Lycorma delicatula]|uniref:ribonuclease P/MRP subunit p14 a n=1 Tax=Lycorma delicatula TaxID=130591 RepID=UPI003F515D04
MCDYRYLDITLSFEANCDIPVSAVDFKYHVVQSVKDVFGEIGASISVDVLKYDSSKKTGIIRCPASSYVKLRSALTLSSEYGGRCCSYTINNSSPLLISLLSNSRTYIHK